ncbi:glucose-6-phosphate isomerase [Aggregicoccus sp. 17bor-14]|uniref:glucose-6-phosphate isomerase n=1 Tax=Myxococcaceae TaxID=31 RepID=UPI00129C909E|nr:MULTISPECIES: glucose-6-phosphate isomerase [Myxococcaceae]MBF5042533.1 glucose-6-phosphate isomerase [Simulacricoccus sp. 17bor-14]MRI88303.1 glucose-6-phosphate isomerase [Aggregicoccus sp. 17bor-14]
MSERQQWERYKKYLCVCEPIGLTLDVSRMGFDDAFLSRMQAPLASAFDAMEALEKGAIANPDEKRRVGHYWLRAPELAPEPGLTRAIQDTVASVRSFAADVHAGRVKPERAARFTQLLVVGIGGSALGPQLVADALGGPQDRMAVHFFDNTDPDGFDRTLGALGERLSETLVLVISKSGGTKETRNGMLEAEAAYKARGLAFGAHAVAVTGEGSELDQVARKGGWLRTFPMWDWVGGRTSVLSAVGLLPAALQGLDIDGLLAGARDTDVLTRSRDALKNPAALLALMWHHAGGGKGAKDMVILPYKDRLLLMSRYLQQLVMESLGKELDLSGKPVMQGIAVYGNKGSTDQHAYVQQLREGVHNFFATFIEVLKDRPAAGMEVEPDITSGDYLLGFLLGTRRALHEKGRESLTLTVRDVSARTVGSLIALYERAVGLYASLVNINAYHQPGVEAGKKAAGAVLALQLKLLAELRRPGAAPRTAEQLAQAVGAPDEVETAFKVLEHLAANPEHGVRREPGASYFEARYRV